MREPYGSLMFTVTFCECAENHAGMQQIGSKSNSGISYQDCLNLAEQYSGRVIDLSFTGSPQACIVVFDNLLPKELVQEFNQELLSLQWDTKAFMYGRVVNKKARYNLCFSESSQEANFAQKQGTIVAFSQVPVLSKVRDTISGIHEKFTGLNAEGNYYYDPEKCYIGYHGDTERRIVVGVRIGGDFPLMYRWYKRGKPTEHETRIQLPAGCVYIMSDLAVGWNWKHKSVEWTLRHAAGNVTE
jgi:hypothetical protein